MSRHLTNTVSNRIINSFLLFALLLMSSCGGKTEVPSVTPTISTTAVSTPTSIPEPKPTSSPTPTERLPKNPSLSAVIGKGSVFRVAWSLDKTEFVISASDAIRVYQADTYKVIAEFPPQEESYLEFSPDGKKLVVSTLGDLYVYDIQDNQEILKIWVGVSLSSIVFKPDSSGFALVMYSHFFLSDPGVSWIDVYNFDSEEPLYELDKNVNQETTEDSPYYRQAAFSPDGRWLNAADSNTGQVKIWDMTTGELSPVHLDHEYVRAVAYSSDGNWLATGGGDQVRIWNAKTNNLVRTISGFDQMIFNLTFSEDSTQLTVEEGDNYPDTFYEVYDLSTGQKMDVLAETEPHDDMDLFLKNEGYMQIDGLPVFSPDGSILVIPDHTRLVIWDLENNQQKSILGLATETVGEWPIPLSVRRMAFDPEGKLLAVCQIDGSVDVWDIDIGQRKLNITSKDATTVTFSADGRYVGIGGRQVVELWDAQTGQQIWQTYMSGLWIQAIEFTDDNQSVIAAASSGRNVTWLDLQTGQIRQSYKLNQHDPSSMVIALNKQLFAAVNPRDSELDTIRIWNLKTGQVFQDIDSYEYGLYDNFITISPDSRLLAGNGDDATSIWSTVTGKVLYTFPTGLQSSVFSPDQQWLALINEEGQLEVWDVSSLAKAPQLSDQIAGLSTETTSTDEVNQDESIIQTNCVDVQPTLSVDRQLSGRLVMEGQRGSSYTLDLHIGKQKILPDYVSNYDISTSPDGKWLAYQTYQKNTGYKTLVFEDVTGKQNVYKKQDDWMSAQWLGKQIYLFSFNVYSKYDEISGTQFILPSSGPTMQLSSAYPGLEPFSGTAGNPYHYGLSSVAYDPTLTLVVYEKTDEDRHTSMVLYDRMNQVELASFPDYYGEHSGQGPIWSENGYFFIASLIEGYNPGDDTDPSREDWFRINRDGSAEQLTHFQDLAKKLYLWGGSLSPDGKYLAFHLMDAASKDVTLAIMNLESKDVMNTCLRDGYITWSPDSKYLVVGEEYESSTYRTILIDMETMQAEQVTDDDDAIPVGWLNAP